jgi:serpin B
VEPFYTADGGQRDVKMMHQTEYFAYAEVEGLRVLTMPYEGDDLAMSLLLPDARDGLPALEAQLSAEALDRWLGASRGTDVRVSLPRFTIDPPGSIALKPMLSAMGMPIAFDRAQADFLNIAEPTQVGENFAISEVCHKAFVKVDEKGTEAAAATGVAVSSPTSVPPPPREFRADHPFIFAIRDTRNGSLLFLGRVVSP